MLPLLAIMAAEIPAWAEDAYLLGVNDEISVMVHGEPEISRTAAITGTCSVDLHFLGAIAVCGRTTAEVAGLVRAGLQDGGFLVDPYVVVDITRHGSHVVELSGQVKQPGTVALAGPTTLSQVIVSAGGPASPNVLEVRVIGRDGDVADYYLPDLETRPDPVWVTAGDKIVLREPLTVIVSGQVQREGTVPFREGLTLSEALALAGGPTEFAGLGRTYVLRANGEKLHVNLRRVSRGIEADLELRPEDQVVIQRSMF